MRILRVIRSVNPKGGGPIEGIQQVSRIMEAAGHSVEVASLDHPGAPWLSDFPLKVHPLGGKRDGYGFSRPFVPWLRAHPSHYDAVIVSGLWQYSSLGTWRALRGTETPYYVFPHGMLDPWFKRAYPFKHLKKWLYWPWAEYRVLRDARAVLFTSEDERRLARQSFWLYRCRERVVSYGTAAPMGDPAAQRAAFLEAVPALRGRRIFLFLGRLHEKKGCELLIRAFAKLTSASSCHPERSGEAESPGAAQSKDLTTPALQHSNHYEAESPGAAHLVLAGPCADANYLAGLKNLASTLCPADSVSFTGMLTGDLKWGALRAAEAFVLPSHQENFGLAVAEALACSLPVLISDKVNIWREIEEDGAGLVAPDTLEGVRTLLHRWVALTGEQKQTMSRAALQCFESRFEVHAAAEALLEIIRNDCSGHAQGMQNTR